MGTPSNQISTEQIISVVDQLSATELEEVSDRIRKVQAERKAPHLSAKESELLLRINQAPTAEKQERLHLLRGKREDDSISNAEYEELTQLTDWLEETHANRLAALADLANLRGVRLPELLDQLGIHLPNNV